MHTSCLTPGALAELAANRKMENLPNGYLFQPLAFESLGFTVTLIGQLGHKISTKSNDERESAFLFPCLAF